MFCAHVLNNNMSYVSLWAEQQWLCCVFVWSICLFQRRGNCRANREMCCDSINSLSPLICSLTSDASGSSPLNTMAFLKFNRKTPSQKFGHVFSCEKKRKLFFFPTENGPYNLTLDPCVQLGESQSPVLGNSDAQQKDLKNNTTQT